MPLATLPAITPLVFRHLCGQPLGVAQWVDMPRMASAMGIRPDGLWSCLEALDRCAYHPNARMVSGRGTPHRIVEILNSSIDRSSQGLWGHADIYVPDFREQHPWLPLDAWAAMHAIEQQCGLFGG